MNNVGVVTDMMVLLMMIVGVIVLLNVFFCFVVVFVVLFLCIDYVDCGVCVVLAYVFVLCFVYLNDYGCWCDCCGDVGLC